MTLLYNMYKPMNFHSGLFSELRYISNGLTIEILYFNYWNLKSLLKFKKLLKFSGLLQND